MAVNTAALKTFAPAMRRQLMEAVGRKLDLLLNSQTPDTLSTYAKQIAELRDEQEKSREQLLERVAYTWFNRLCALRYLDAKGWHPFGCKVLMPAGANETQPELLKLMRSGSLPGDLKTFTNEQRLNQLLDGHIPTAIPGGDAQSEVYRELVLAACRSYHNLLPDLFEGLDDASELLLPDDLLTEGSIAGSFRSSISDSDCDDVEIIGWLYQFYISEKKDEVIGKVVKSEDIPAATQLFTPNWIVKYMVQNTIGAQWLATYPDSPLREQMEFYIEPAEQTDEVKAKLAEITPKTLNPEELTMMDPACGSGHILVEAYEIFKAIYLEQGYQLREIPKLIFEKNLFGLDIDQRAAQLTRLALLMKGREDDRRLLERKVKLNLIALHSSADFNPHGLKDVVDVSAYGMTMNDLIALKDLFKNATIYGALIQPEESLAKKILAAKALPDGYDNNPLVAIEIKRLNLLVNQAKILSKAYSSVLVNPPYMGQRLMNSDLNAFVNKRYSSTSGNLFACFIERCLEMLGDGALIGMITLDDWISQASYKTLREEVIQKRSIKSLVHIGYNTFPSMNSKIATGCAFTLSKKPMHRYLGTYIDLNSAPQSSDKQNVFLDNQLRKTYLCDQVEFKSLPASELAFSTSSSIIELFEHWRPLSIIGDCRQGLSTGNTSKFLRRWHEVDYKEISGIHDDEQKISRKWSPHCKGGGERRWYGNHDWVINWGKSGEEIKAAKGSVIRNESYYFRPGITWCDLTTGPFTARILPPGFVFDTAGPAIFFDNNITPKGLIGYMNSQVFQMLCDATIKGLHYSNGSIAKIPIPPEIQSKNDDVHEEIVYAEEQLIDIFKDNYAKSEEHWEFKNWHKNQLSESHNAESCFQAIRSKSSDCFSNTLHLISIIDEYFFKACNLEQRDQASSQAINDNIPRQINGFILNNSSIGKSLLSYATGCMMGRYSLDHPGLILADSRSNQDKQLAAYEAKIRKPINQIHFKPDADAIIPVLDGEWFEDDIVARTREFLKVTFPDSSVAENLRFIEDSIGKDIRKYFCSDFYKDHLQTYKKRPIYWMVQSPAGPSRGGFACLIYLHRYTPDTLLQVLNNYFRPYLQKLEARQVQLERDQNNDALPKREQTAARKEAEKITKVLKECQAWEQDALLPLAQQRIELDLDDGVKVNYIKLQEVLAKIPGLAAKGD